MFALVIKLYTYNLYICNYTVHFTLYSLHRTQEYALIFAEPMQCWLCALLDFTHVALPQLSLSNALTPLV